MDEVTTIMEQTVTTLAKSVLFSLFTEGEFAMLYNFTPLKLVYCNFLGNDESYGLSNFLHAVICAIHSPMQGLIEDYFLQEKFVGSWFSEK